MENENPGSFKLKFPHYIVIRDKVIPTDKAMWYLFYILLGISLIALFCIILYVQVYIHSFTVRIDCNPEVPLNYEKCLDRG